MKSRFSMLLGLSFLTLFTLTANSMFMPGERAPVDRLIRNVSEQYKRTPKDAEVVYTLGRLHSLAFAQGSKEIHFYPPTKRFGDTRKVLSFGPYGNPKVKPDDTFKTRKAEALSHLGTSLQLYKKAIALKPKEGLYLFSYAWMLEQGAPFAAEVSAPFLAKPAKTTSSAWSEQALKMYRRAFEVSQEKDLKLQHILAGADIIVSIEAGQAILDAYKSRTLTEAAKAEKLRIEAHLKKMYTLPRAVTPLIFPLDGQQTLAELTYNTKPVRFNLSAEAKPRLWKWVTPNTGILVWSPEQKEAITSGKQLFGSVTWWIFWKNGFEPLAALDDNRDGYLSGSELNGIGIWQDKNSNGRSDTGEVVPIQKWNVKRIAVRPTGQHDGVPSHSQGIELQDGTTRPLYDWTPTSISEGSR
jgi:hypothetical protein